MRYNPTNPPSVLTSAWLHTELRKIAEAMEQATDSTRLIPTAALSTKPQEGEIRVANGTSWDPGRGAGTYIYREGAWQLIEAGFTDDSRSLKFFLGE